MICGKTRAQAGSLHRAHVLAESKGGRVTVRLCPNHHAMYDNGQLTKSQLAKIGVSPTKYARYRPVRGRKKAKPSQKSPYDLNFKVPDFRF